MKKDETNFALLGEQNLIIWSGLPTGVYWADFHPNFPIQIWGMGVAFHGEYENDDKH